MREMKDSGYGYLGDIPVAWKVERIKNHLRFSTEKNPGGVAVLSLYREYGVVPKDSRDDNHNVTSEDTSNYRYVRIGDFVVNKMKAWQGSMAVSDFEGVVSPAYYVYNFITNDIDRKYLHYLLRSKCYAEEFRRLSAGIRIGQWDLPKSEFETTCIAIPTLDEQRNIARIIESQISRIDALVSNVQMQIEKLKTYKQSLIAEVVTKGINRETATKECGNEYIGVIPAHWKSIKIKYLCSMQAGKTLISEQIEEIGDYFVYGGNGIRGYFSDFNYNGTCLLVGRQGALCGNVHQVSGKFWATEHAVITEPKEGVNLRYLFYLLTGMNLNLYVSPTAAQPGLSVSTVQNVITCLAPEDEQKEIVAFLDPKCLQIDHLVEIKQKKIEKLEQYKKSLVYEYVTGKKEVS